jgi:putative transposase
VPDFKLLDETIRAIVVERPDPQELPQHLCLDAGFDNAATRMTVQEHGYIGHIRPARQGPRPQRQPGRRKARRWVVERLLAWLSKCRALLVRYDKHWENYLGLIQLACGLLWYRRLYRLNAA